MKFFKLYLFFIFIPLLSSSQSRGKYNFPYNNPSLPIEQRVSDLISRMTLVEKIRQLDMYRGEEIADIDEHNYKSALSTTKMEKVINSVGVGSIRNLYPNNPVLTNEIQKFAITKTRLGIPILMIEEGLHGYNAKGTTNFPVPIALAGSWDTSLVYHVGRVIATEARSSGVDMLLCPVLGLARDPRWGRVQETYGEDPYLTACNAVAMVKGLQGDTLMSPNSVVAVLKHFAVYSIPEGGSNTSPVSIGEREARSSFLVPFEAAIKTGNAKGMMVSYNENDGIPNVVNSWLLKDLLRKEWGFNGIVLPDLGAIKWAIQYHHTAINAEDAIAQVIKAGVDMQFYDFTHQDFEDAIQESLRKQELTIKDLNRAVENVLRVKFMLGLFDHPFIDTSYSTKAFGNKQNHALSLKAAQEGICLLKNENNLLPLHNGIHSISVIGGLAKSEYTGDYSPIDGKGVSLLDGLKSRVAGRIKINYAEGYSEDTLTNLKWGKTFIEKAKQASISSDISIVVLGEYESTDGENKDRADLNLPRQQENLIQALSETGKPIIVVLLNGRPLAIDWIAQHIPAIVEGWYGGESAGLAIADVLLGNVNPSGKLPITFPRSVGQLPFYYDHKPSSWHLYVDEKNTPLFPFGFGLSYTTFQYSKLEVYPEKISDTGTVHISLNVENTGQMRGTEVVQLYVRDEESSVTTPVKALKGFRRVTLNPNESKEINFSIAAKQLAIWNRKMKHVVEPGKFTVMIGSSSEDIKVKGAFIVSE